MCENRRDFLPCPQQQLLPALRACFRLSPMEQTRLIIDEPRAGSTNMAFDEAILTAVGQGQAAPTLRFYRWSTATIQPLLCGAPIGAALVVLVGEGILGLAGAIVGRVANEGNAV